MNFSTRKQKNAFTNNRDTALEIYFLIARRQKYRRGPRRDARAKYQRHVNSFFDRSCLRAFF